MDTSVTTTAATSTSTTDKLDLVFIANEWIRYGPRSDHKHLDLAHLAYCYVEFFKDRANQISDWARFFDNNWQNVQMSDEVSLTAM